MTPPLVPESWTARATMVLSTVSRSRVELTARLTSPHAFSSLTDRASPPLRTRTSLQLLEQADVLDGDDGLVGKRRHQLDLLVGKRLDLAPLQYENSSKDVLPEHRDSQEGPETAHLLSLSHLVFGVRKGVMDVDHSALQRSPPRRAASPRADRLSLMEISELRGDAVVSHRTKDLAVKPKDKSLIRCAEACGVLHPG